MAGISLSSNISALRAKRGLDTAMSASSRVLERLSSGLRINRASDDAAGLAIASNLNSGSRVFTQGIRNINDGQSLLAIADSTVSELSNIVVRLRELAEQSANGTFSGKQRIALDKEAQELSKEYSRITRSTQFNGLHTFDGTLSQGLRLQGGYGIDGSIQSSLGGALGTGTFSSNAAIDLGPNNIYGTALGDVNGDGVLDLVSAGYNGATGSAYVQFGIGDGTFSSATSYDSDIQGSRALSLGDLNGDGTLDLVTAGIGSGTGSATVRIGKGDGTFGAVTSYAQAEINTFSLSMADLNGDSVLDMVTAGQGAGNGSVTVRLGLGNGTFSAAVSYDAGGIISLFAGSIVSLSDFNRDGIVDMGVATSGGTGAIVNIRLGNGDGTFGSAASYDTEVGYGPRSLAVGDLNGDGILDILTTGAGAGVNTITVRLGKSDGSFSAATSYAGQGNSRALAVADVNGDGILDILNTATTNQMGVKLGVGDGTFGAETLQTISTMGAYAFSFGDVTGDGVLDVFMGGLNSISSLTGISRDGINPLLTFSLKTQSDSLQSMGYLDRTLSNLSKQRGIIGAFQSRLDSALSNLRSTAENYTAAASRITDTDIAQESAELARNQILQQTATAVLAQANQLPALALRLLKI